MVEQIGCIWWRSAHECSGCAELGVPCGVACLCLSDEVLAFMRKVFCRLWVSLLGAGGTHFPSDWERYPYGN